MSEKNKPLDVEKLAEYADQYILEFVKVITSKPKSKEMSAAAVTALGAVLAIVATKLVGIEKAADVIAMAVSSGLRNVSEAREEMGL